MSALAGKQWFSWEILPVIELASKVLDVSGRPMGAIDAAYIDVLAVYNQETGDITPTLFRRSSPLFQRVDAALTPVSQQSDVAAAIAGLPIDPDADTRKLRAVGIAALLIGAAAGGYYYLKQQGIRW